MKCVICGCDELKVINSRPYKENTFRRRRECQECLTRYTTYELISVAKIDDYALKKKAKDLG